MNMNDNERSLLTENESLRAENMELRSLLTLAKEARAEAAERAKDGAYRERDKLVAALSVFFPAWLERHPEEEEWEDDWRWTVFILGDAPSGQMAWHIHDSELPLFDHLQRSKGHRWDGHSTEEKYERLANARPEAAERGLAEMRKLHRRICYDGYEKRCELCKTLWPCESVEAARAAGEGE
jgi:hypothetical protein